MSSGSRAAARRAPARRPRLPSPGSPAIAPLPPAIAATPVGATHSAPLDVHTSVDQSAVRRHNLSAVLRLLHDRGPRSRASIAVETGLTKATVSSIVAELEERRLVRDLGVGEARRLGRPARLVEVDGSTVAALALELNVDYVGVLATDLAGRTLFERRRPLAARTTPRARVVRAVATLATQALDAVAQAGCTTIAGVTLGVPGIVDTATGVLRFAPNLDWRDVALIDQLRSAISKAVVGRPAATLPLDGVPFEMDNEANLAAFAEYRVGRAVGADTLVCIIGEVGVGGGIIIGGRLLRGSTGVSGEVGHMAMVRDGARCGCGALGCWETLVGLHTLVRAAVPDRAGELEGDARFSAEDKIAVIVERADRGDPITLAALREVGTWLGLGIANLVNIVNPDLVVLAGYYAVVADWVLPTLETALRSHALGPSLDRCRVEMSTLGLSASVRGGAVLAADRVFADPGLVPVPIL